MGCPCQLTALNLSVRNRKDVRFFVGVSKELFKDFAKEGLNVNAEFVGLVHSKSIGDSAERALPG